MPAALTLRALTAQQDQLAPGHGLCAGCSESIIVRQVLAALGRPAVVALATGCLEVATTRYPWTAWQVPTVHNAFENAATTISGVEAAYRALARRGKVSGEPPVFVVFAGDGATYDIGLQWLSGALERGHRFLYVCLNNEGYMNTGAQRSSATIQGTWTTTTPVGTVVPGKPQWRKDVTAIVAAHHIPYVAQAAPHHWKDLMAKVQKAAAKQGPAFINVLAPCNRGWRFEPEETIRLSRLAADTCVWPLFEVDEGAWKLSYRPAQKRPIVDWLKAQGRFSHLLDPQRQDLALEVQSRVDQEWQQLLSRCGSG
ncbi:MAG: pyruvate ferredoxin oxidoreductase [Chloroflexi bacterium]|nr:pyruvate ferredoxin oxidoreductase [Chloroflexota bacterium]